MKSFPLEWATAMDEFKDLEDLVGNRLDQTAARMVRDSVHSSSR